MIIPKYRALVWVVSMWFHCTWCKSRWSAEVMGENGINMVFLMFRYIPVYVAKR